MSKSKQILSIGLAFSMFFSAITPMVAIAADYSDFPVYQEMKEDNLNTAPEIKLNESYNVVFRNGTYTNSDKTSICIINDSRKVLKFIPTTTGYYESSIYVAEKNQHINVMFCYSDTKSLKNNKYYYVDKGSYESSIYTSKEPGTYNSDYNKYRKTARGAAYLEKGKTYYIIASAKSEDCDVEKEMQTEIKGYTYHSVPATIKVYKHTHDYNVNVSKYSDRTWAYYNCEVCNYSKSSLFYKPAELILSSTSYTYDGKVKKPTVTVKDVNGNKISSSNYTVSYSSGRKNVGKYKVTVKFKGDYARFTSLNKTFTIKPKSTTISKVSPLRKGFKVTWKKQATQTTGYQVQYSTSSRFSSAKTITISKNSSVSKSVSKLTGGKKYFVRVRTYKAVNGTKYYSKWSGYKSVTTKR